MDDTETGDSYRRIGQGFCGSVWASEHGKLAYKREDGGPDRSIWHDYQIHLRILEAAADNVTICIPRWPSLVTSTDSAWWENHLAKFSTGYKPCNVLYSERIPPMDETARNLLIERYCPPQSQRIIKNNDADRDCLVRLYLGRRKLQNAARRGRSFFSLRNYPLHLNQAEDLGLDVEEYAVAMADTLSMLHWTAQVDAKDVEFVLGGTQGTVAKHHNNVFGSHSLWLLDFDLCDPMPMNEKGIEQAAIAFLKNDPYFPRPSATTGSPNHDLWMSFRKHYLRYSQKRVENAKIPSSLPETFIDRVEEIHLEALEKRGRGEE